MGPPLKIFLMERRGCFDARQRRREGQFALALDQLPARAVNEKARRPRLLSLPA